MTSKGRYDTNKDVLKKTVEFDMNALQKYSMKLKIGKKIINNADNL